MNPASRLPLAARESSRNPEFAFFGMSGRYHTTRKEENEEIENLNVNGNVIRKVNI